MRSERSSCGCGAGTCCSPSPQVRKDSGTGNPCCQPGQGANIPLVSSRLAFRDRLGTWMARWGIGRNRYRVAPGLYGLGRPDADSPVLVTANYKMTFDYVRSRISGLNAWLLVLDTRGINVWCAAGKGTFGTEELCSRIRSVNLEQTVRHRRLVLPQLGAPGVAAHEVLKKTGFRVLYGPVDAADIPAFISNGFRATAAMRSVPFGLKQRLPLIPMEFIPALRLVPFFVAWVAVLFWAHRLPWDSGFWIRLIPYLAALLAGSVLFQILLPWLPFRSFSLNGWLLGIAVAAGFILAAPGPLASSIGLLFLLPPITAYLSLNFTGATTFTNLSGVKKELRLGLPAIILSLAAGVFLSLL